MSRDKQNEKNSLVLGWEFAYQNARPCIVITEQIGDEIYILGSSFESEGKIELKGYRESQEVAEEIFAEIEEILHNLAQLYLNCDLKDNFGICYSIYEEAVLPIKKKYTENEINAVYKHYTTNGATFVTSEPIESEDEE